MTFTRRNGLCFHVNLQKRNQANVKLVCASFQLEDATVNLDK